MNSEFTKFVPCISVTHRKFLHTWSCFHTNCAYLASCRLLNFLMSSFSFAGYSCHNKSTLPVECPAGTYSTSGSIHCFDCANGTYQVTERYGFQSAHILTVVHFPFQNSSAQSECITCLEGHRCSTPGITSPIVCPKGTYAIAGSQSCTVCPEGYYAETEGQSTCQVGKYTIWLLLNIYY